MAKTRRSFTREYKLQAVHLVTEKGFSFAEAAKAGVFEYIEVFYNRQRRHSFLG